MLTPTIRGLWLKLETSRCGSRPASTCCLDVPGVVGPRAFSIANGWPTGDRAAHSPRPRRPRTGWLHEQLKVGDKLAFSGPFGRFFVRKSAAQPMIFVAGGSGLSSPKSMILDLLAEGCEQPITLLQGARNRGELYFADLFSQLAQEHPNFRYIPALSDLPAGHDWQGARGFVHETLKAAFDNDFRGHKAYLCGPPPMIEACIATFMQGRLFERDIYTEKFYTAADAAQPARRSPLFKSI